MRCAIAIFASWIPLIGVWQLVRTSAASKMVPLSKDKTPFIRREILYRSLPLRANAVASAAGPHRYAKELRAWSCR
jgi:hypothetical protein